MKNLRNKNIKGLKVLVRCDLNVPIKNGKVLDDFRIKKLIPTIDYLRNQGAKIILITHLGEPKGRDLSFSVRPVAKRLWELVQGRLKFVNDTIGKRVKKEIDEMKEGDIIVLENLRFYKEEKQNDDDFSRSLARLGDIFVQDAFGACHRNHSSIVGITKYIDSFPGLLLEEEIRVLSDALVSPDRPLVSIVGGFKVSSKIKVIKSLLDKSDYLLLGGRVANSLLISKGLYVKDLLSSEEEELMEVAKEINLTDPKLQLPIDGVMGLINFDEDYSRIGGIGSIRKEEDVYDIGPETIEKYKNILSTAKTIIWNGPLGYFEKEKFSKGTEEIAKMIGQINSEVFSIVGGGETVEAIQKLGIENQFDHISTGGGAMLDFIAGKELPGIKALEYEN
ncbi:MAG TPA: phosphoglycerate kinase [Candidatus Pacearchaeota archaeon]|nr:phosphoglycerate kinase [Candidatus Pacearchaeota archaeon]HOS12741.1 phosphoglycerate kinase [Candidatus Pacearchaeota archaeon]HPL72628.1 phosphoglycerate kinase [Candidatus Pacearchaeota archaeon]